MSETTDRPDPPVIWLDHLNVNEQRRLVWDYRHGGDPIILGEGWYRADKPLFPEYRGADPNSNVYDFGYHSQRRRPRDGKTPVSSVEDMDRLVWFGVSSLDSDEHDFYCQIGLDDLASEYNIDRKPKNPTPEGKTVVEFAEIVPEVRGLLEEVRSKPRAMLNPEHRRKAWLNNPSARPALVGIVAGILVEFRPWPYPFAERSPDEKRLSVHQVQAAVVQLFDRLLDAPAQRDPPGLAGMFVALITQRRVPLTAWAEPFSGVWGFKMRTSDHYWLKGITWMEPGMSDELHSPMEFHDGGKRVSAGAFRCVLDTARD